MFRSISFTLSLLLTLSLSYAQPPDTMEILRLEKQAKQVSIIRDNWGIPHVYGETDADVVFGLLYAQCEDDFKRVEMNYIEKLGRMSEVNGAASLWDDLYLKLIIDSVDAIADYKKSPPRFKILLDAFADGINYYLYKHPEVKPALLKRFEPWYALLWTDGSIGAISTGSITEKDVENFYGGYSGVYVPKKIVAEEPVIGSNGFAISPFKTESGNAMLYINPHVTFYFRPEVHMVSKEGLNVYGAVTWGQFFIYQGFNEHCGWMHTSSEVDVSDMYAEKVLKQNGKWVYEYNHEFRPVKEKEILIGVKMGSHINRRKFTTYSTHHGPVMAKMRDRWISVKGYNRSLQSLIQSWQRTKATGFESYKAAMALYANTSNNTVYADDRGNIAYWHGNYIPVRDTAFNWAKPVDGTTPATEWKGLHTMDQSVHLYNPPNGWLQNCNSTPFSVAGVNSPKRENYPVYMAPDGENYRGINAVRVLARENKYTLDKLIAAGYDTYLAAFEKLIPALVNAAKTLPDDTIYRDLQPAIDTLKNWNMRSGENSIATTLAVEWAQRLIPKMTQSGDEDEYQFVYQVKRTDRFLAVARPRDLVLPLVDVLDTLSKRFGSWQIPWGQINRFQRISSDIDQQYKDSAASIPVGFTSSIWGQLPSYTSRYYPGTIKRYGVNGNSFICAVEFGKKVKAKSLLAGGETGDPLSPHFNDQMEMYRKGIFKDVLFYREDVLKHAEKTYHPGE
jgi:acyl-homoserine-lactone acylase